MAAAFALVIAPNAWWLVNHDFLPFRYVDERAARRGALVHYLLYPLQWTGGQRAVSPAGARAAGAAVSAAQAAPR